MPPCSIVSKPWGHELIWALTERYAGKILHVRAGEALSLQYHQVKDETIMVLAGRLLFEFFTVGAEPCSQELGPGEPFHITPGLRHRMTARRCLRTRGRWGSLEAARPIAGHSIRLGRCFSVEPRDLGAAASNQGQSNERPWLAILDGEAPAIQCHTGAV